MPGLSEKILYLFSIKDFDEFLKRSIPANTNTPTIYDSYIEGRIRAHINQDAIAKRSVNEIITCQEVKDLLIRYNYRCIYCWNELDWHDWSLDRIDNGKPHT